MNFLFTDFNLMNEGKYSLSPKFITNKKLTLVDEETIVEPINKSFKDSLISFKNFISVIPTTPSEQDFNNFRLVLSGELFYHKHLIIEQTGIKKGLRNKNNGISFFGYTNDRDQNGDYYNDFIIMCDETKPFQETSSGRVFSITFNQILKEYQLNFLDRNLFLFHDIEEFIYFEIGKRYVFSIGSVIVNIQVFLSHLKQVIKIEIEFENNKFQSFSFSEDEAPITIGRKCSTITIPRNNISKNHAVIKFSKETNLFYFQDLQSSNGSILILKEDNYITIKGLMKFKLNDITFTIMEIF